MADSTRGTFARADFTPHRHPLKPAQAPLRLLRTIAELLVMQIHISYLALQIQLPTKELG